MSRNEVAATRGNLPEFSQWVQAMQVEADLEPDEEFDPATILNSILSADSFEKAVEAQTSSLTSGKNFTDQVHTIYSFELRKSDDKYTTQNDRSLGVYAIVHAADETGNEINYGVGAANVLAILWQARQFGKLPGKFMLKARETRNGDLLSLMPVKTAVQAK